MKKYFLLVIALAMALTLSACKASKAEPTALPSVPAVFAGMTMPHASNRNTAAFTCIA